MRIVPPRISLIGEDTEIRAAETVLRNSNAIISRYTTLDEACEKFELDPTELFIIGPGLYFQTHLNQIQKLEPTPAILLAVADKIPNLAKILVPNIVFIKSSAEEALWTINHSVEISRNARRLDMLRDHQKRSISPETNPAIQLVTSLMKRCTASEEYTDLLRALHSLKSIMDFQDSTFLALDGDGNVIDGWHCYYEVKEKIAQLQLSGKDKFPFNLVEGQVHELSSSDHEALSRFTQNPWSSALALKVDPHLLPRKASSIKSAIIILFRRELFPFVERDHWLLELVNGPLALAMEKIAMLKAISLASKEWRSTFDGITEALTVIDSNYQIVKANKAFAALVDADIKKVKGKRCFSLLANRRSPCIGCPVNFESQPQGGTQLQLSGKGKKDLLVWSYGIRTGLDTYFFQFYRNVSKETNLTAALIQSEKMAALGRLVGAVAHEINNPLAGILATSQILLQENIDDANFKEDLAEIRDAAWRSKKIIDDLLGFTSSEEKKFDFHDPEEIVRSALTFSKAALKQVNVHIQKNSGSEKIFVSASALQQILFNLITNASHAMQGQGSLTINITSKLEAINISIKDTGPGIPQEKLTHIFDPFYTSKKEGAGTGLGLSIVKNLTQKIHGKIEVQSTVGVGTEFIVSIPTGATQ